MKLRNSGKKAGAYLLAFAMIAASLPALSVEVRADGPDTSQFATKEQLRYFDTNDKEGANPAAEIIFGSNDHKWWIAGSQTDDSIVLFAASPLAWDQEFESEAWDNKTYDTAWNCTYVGDAPTEVFPNHYGASPLRTMLNDLESSYFTPAEQGLMKETTIYTEDVKQTIENDLNICSYATNDKLHLAYGDYFINGYITVGANTSDGLNDGLRVDWSYCGNDDFWLRTVDPNPSGDGYSVLVAKLDGESVWASIYGVNFSYALVPAFELDLSSVLFASAAPAASAAAADGTLTTTANEFTLRYAQESDENMGAIDWNPTEKKVIVSGIGADTYLVVQNSDGAWAKQVADGDTVSPSEITINGSPLSTLANCRVWIEKTEDRVTKAVMANMDYRMEVPADVTFDDQHVGYQEVSAKKVSVKNTGISDIANVEAVLTGTNADAFTLDTTGIQTSLASAGETSFSVKPNTGLKPGTYEAEIEITGEVDVARIVPISFTVENHKYTSNVIPPTCTNQGYTAHTCKVCGDFYTGGRTDPVGHSFQEGKCTVCGAADPEYTADVEQKVVVLTAQERDLQNRTLNSRPTKIKFKNAPMTTVQYTSSDETVVTVDAEGNIKYTGVGEAVITIKVAAENGYKEAVKELKVVVGLDRPTFTPFSQNDAFTLTTSKVKGAEKFQIQYVLNGKSFQSAGARIKTITADKKLKLGKVEAGNKKTYRIRVRAVSGAVKSQWSPVKKITTK